MVGFRGFYNSKALVITSGYFNPIHPGHIDCFRLSKSYEEISKHVSLADIDVDQVVLRVIINNDIQAELKRGIKSFQNEKDRLSIVKSIKYVDEAVLSIDTDLTVCKTLEKQIIEARDMGYAKILFTKGGDRFSHNTPEKTICDQWGVVLIDGLGAKTHNSSDYVKKKA